MAHPNFINTIVFVDDIERAKKFYSEVLMVPIAKDFGVFIIFENHFAIHQRKAILETVFKDPAQPNLSLEPHKNLIVYFEYDNLEDMLERVQSNGKEIIHGIEAQAWGQRVFRFYDDDKNIVEIGEPLEQ